MSDTDLNITLNVATLPRRRPKSQNNAITNHIKETHKDNLQSFQTNINTNDNPSRSILKEKKQTDSVWKIFKKVNKTVPKSVVPVFKNKNLEFKKIEKFNKSVTFDNKNTEGLSIYSEESDSNVGAKKTTKDVNKEKKRSVHEESDFQSKSFKFPLQANHAYGKHTSLFGNNPEIPQIPHKAVKPLKEPVFSSLCFNDIGLHPYMVKYLDESMGLTKMTTVQQKSIPVLLKKKDVLIRSQTGSGKTLAFALPILHHLQEIRPKINRIDGVMSLVVVPTRELALQTYEVFNKLVKSYTWIVPGYLVGGEKRKSEKARIRKGITILIGTPGRLVDHLQNTSCLNVDKVSWLVLDEADRLFDMGYEKDVSNIIAALDKGKTSLLSPEYISPGARKSLHIERHTVLLSATLTPKVMQLAGLSLTNPVFVDACDDAKLNVPSVPIFSTEENCSAEIVALPENLTQQYIVVPAKLRLVILSSLILWKCKLTEEKKLLIFVATQDMVDYHAELLSTALSVPGEDESDCESETLSTSGVKFFKLHGSMNQPERTEVFNTFRKAESGVLFCTDVAARGLDLPEVDWVIQYNGPTSIADYVHRVGRTARGGQSGSSIIFLLPSEVNFIVELENHRIRLNEMKMERCLKKLWTFYSNSPTAEEAASTLQSAFETVVSEQSKMYSLACKAYSSWSRSYAGYPRNMKKSFNIKSVHQGHYAKSFALKDPPSVIINHAKAKSLNNERSAKEKPLHRKRAGKTGFPFKRKRVSDVSEFDSGLEPIRKKAK